MPINIAGKTFPCASGFLPIASMALKPMSPMAKAGPIPPIAIAAPFAKTISKRKSPPQCAFFCVKITIKTKVSIAKIRA